MKSVQKRGCMRMGSPVSYRNFKNCWIHNARADQVMNSEFKGLL